MPENTPVTLAVDAVGGDFAPDAILEGLARALEADDCLHLAITGPAEVVGPFASSHDRTTAYPTTEVIEMGEHAAGAVRTKRDSSIVVGARLVKEGKADGFFSAGNTGATMAAALLVMGRIKGAGPPVVVLDIGANADCRPEHLLQFAHMGAAYSRAVVGVEAPRVALLNIGEEPGKGSALAQEAHAMMAGSVPGFIGNLEGRDIPFGRADVIVTDGFTGNVVLKLMEGLADALFGELKDTMTTGTLNRAATAVLAPSLRSMKARLDPDAYGAAPLLGIDGLALIGHGSSSAEAIVSAMRYGARAVREGLVASIADSVVALDDVTGEETAS
jgi:glycerol-3-phosphate acyltransferase PlsX